MKVLVAGATGAVGKQLVAAGHEVTGMTRSPEKADALRALGAKAAVAGGLDRTAVREVSHACEEVCCLPRREPPVRRRPDGPIPHGNHTEHHKTLR
jgi:uncharacterized protein YbjT (DUF2867 family)